MNDDEMDSLVKAIRNGETVDIDPDDFELFKSRLDRSRERGTNSGTLTVSIGTSAPAGYSDMPMTATYPERPPCEHAWAKTPGLGLVRCERCGAHEITIDGIKAQARRVSRRTTVKDDELECALRKESLADRNFADHVIERVIGDASRAGISWKHLIAAVDVHYAGGYGILGNKSPDGGFSLPPAGPSKVDMDAYLLRPPCTHDGPGNESLAGPANRLRALLDLAREYNPGRGVDVPQGDLQAVLDLADATIGRAYDTCWHRNYTLDGDDNVCNDCGARGKRGSTAFEAWIEGGGTGGSTG